LGQTLPAGICQQHNHTIAADRRRGGECRLDSAGRMDSPDRDHLRVLVANEREDRIGLVTTIVAALGHTVIAGSTDVSEVGALTSREHPDVALVGLGLSTDHALDLIGRIVHEASCPVIAVLESRNAEFVAEAARRGVFAYIVDTDSESLQSAIDITLRRYAEFNGLQGAFGRRAVTERAKGIIMERHQIDEAHAFELLRGHARRSGRKITDVAQAIVDGHALLPATPGSARLRGAD
jgi:AmiR/NasT family two-component response regulator